MGSPRPPTGSAEHHAAASVVVALLIVAVAVILLSRMDDPLGVRPDSWSEAEVMVSGIGYARVGFLAHAALPQHQIGPPLDPYFLYANYPVLSNVLYGVLHRLGADAHGLFRLPAIMASLLALWVWYRLVTRVVDRPTGVAATLALGSSFGFLSYADNIHQQAYPMAAQFGALLCFINGVAPHSARRWRWLLGCALCLLVVSLLTVELHLWLPMFFVGYALLFGSAVSKRWLLILVVPLCLGVALQWLQGSVGSPVPPGERPGMADNLYRRSIGFDAAADTPWDGDKRLGLATYPGYMLKQLSAFYRFPVWLLAPLMMLGFAGLAVRRRPAQWPAQIKLLVILLAAALGWTSTMMQQTAVHQATMRQFLPFYALLIGVIWTQCARVALDAGRRPYWRVLAPLVGLATLVPHCSAAWSNMQMHLDRRYRDPVLQEPGWQESADFAALRRLPEQSVVLTNHNRVPLIRYWSRRPTYLAPNALIPTASPPGRSWLEMTLNYLRGLSGEPLPRLVYLYYLGDPTPPNIQRALATDPLLRALTTGSFAPFTSQQALEQAARVVAGALPGAAPVLASGREWRCFDMTPILPPLLEYYRQFPIPTLKEMPAPR